MVDKEDGFDLPNSDDFVVKDDDGLDVRDDDGFDVEDDDGLDVKDDDGFDVKDDDGDFEVDDVFNVVDDDDEIVLFTSGGEGSLFLPDKVSVGFRSVTAESLPPLVANEEEMLVFVIEDWPARFDRRELV